MFSQYRRLVVPKSAEELTGKAMTEETTSVNDGFRVTAEQVEEMRHHVLIYVGVFMGLAVLTVVTVAIAYLDAPAPLAIGIALLIASTKGSLVACYFMHLIDERKMIYWILLLTAFFFAVMMTLPMGQYLDPGPNVE